MLTRHHLVLGLLCSFIFGSAIAVFNLSLAVLVIGGTGIGVILPDIHMKRPKKSILLMVAWVIVQAGSVICVPVMCALYSRFFKIAAEPGDKRLTHSIPGVFLYLTILAGIAYVLVFLFKNYIPVFLAMGFLGGILLGMLLHLAEDLCTRKGISPFYPLNDTRIFGSIRPCDVLDNRVLRFHLYHGSILSLFLVFQFAMNWSGYYLITFGFLSIGICVVSMVCQSDVRITLPENRFSDTREAITA
jgi:membrane-bound metal-dependent hydrolase YbcI (DUF457 family)